MARLEQSDLFLYNNPPRPLITILYHSTSSHLFWSLNSNFIMATANNTMLHTTEHGIPKEHSPSVSANIPPPAYSPRQPLALSSFAQATQLASSPLLTQDDTSLLDRSTFAEMINPQLEDTDETETQSTSSISLRINTSINIAKDNNLICIRSTPDQHAKSIAHAVVKAMQESSSGQCGIPMIDEDGRPRPINIEVDASMVIEGSGNVLGDESVINEAIRQRSLRRRRAPDDDEEEGPAKRRCSSSST